MADLHLHSNNDSDWISRLDVVAGLYIHLVNDARHWCYGSLHCSITTFHPTEL